MLFINIAFSYLHLLSLYYPRDKAPRWLIKFSSQRRDRLLFLSTNIATMTSHTNQKLEEHWTGISRRGLGFQEFGKQEFFRLSFRYCSTEYNDNENLNMPLSLKCFSYRQPLHNISLFWSATSRKRSLQKPQIPWLHSFIGAMFLIDQKRLWKLCFFKASDLRDLAGSPEGFAGSELINH